MALNPPITSSGNPFRVDGELFILLRDKMEIEVKIPGVGKKSAKGKIFVTSCRIVFVSNKYESEPFKSFDIPIMNLRKEKFEQPVFGSNYLAGDVEPLFNLLPGTSSFKLWFTAGGCDTFLRVLDRILKQARQRASRGLRGLEPQFVNEIQTGNLQSQKAYYDPNDPSVIYMVQPKETLNANEQKNYYGGNIAYQNVDQVPSNQQQVQQQPQYQQYNPQNQPQYEQYVPQQQLQQQIQQPQYQQYQQQQYIQQPQYQQYQQPQQIQQPQYQPYNPQQQIQYQQYVPQQQPQQYNPQQQNQPQNYNYPDHDQYQQQQLNTPQNRIEPFEIRNPSVVGQDQNQNQQNGAKNKYPELK